MPFGTRCRVYFPVRKPHERGRRSGILGCRLKTKHTRYFMKNGTMPNADSAKTCDLWQQECGCQAGAMVGENFPGSKIVLRAGRHIQQVCGM